ncbi:class I SAM-dependent methyltransferase [Amycolatopsis sacchari]|uniref:Methyltransferase domain-containing protein n=1 Tax=Amycolatopsis sacchari TaxID=115433 RepID=A0A1I3RHP3_9PSEU|nr:class I SAM-dependent methyltransferase [Amycolatopsis sacchari]SFJ46073.1 Methyltransferase domain-containing protein [Amycolatopsis sacchari]
MTVRGVAQVLAFNWPKVLGGAAVAVAGFLPVPAPLRRPVRWGSGAAAWFTFASLAASWWVYDLSGLYRWSWLRPVLPARVRRHVLITAGFDEVSPTLPAVLPGSVGVTLDVLDPDAPVEASIRRARKRFPARALQARAHALPVGTASADLVLAVLAAHELRTPAGREALFAEARRVLRPGGRLVLVEHHRDLPNVLAFGPGAWHFYPRREWNRVAARAGLRPVARLRRTPLVSATAFEARELPAGATS